VSNFSGPKKHSTAELRFGALNLLERSKGGRTLYYSSCSGSDLASCIEDNLRQILCLCRSLLVRAEDSRARTFIDPIKRRVCPYHLITNRWTGYLCDVEFILDPRRDFRIFRDNAKIGVW